MKFDLRPLRSIVAICAALCSFATFSAGAQSNEGPPQRLIIKWRASGIGVEHLTSSSVAITDAQQRHAVGFSSVRRTASGAEVVKLNHRLEKPDLQDLINSVKQDPNVEYVEEDR